MLDETQETVERLHRLVMSAPRRDAKPYRGHVKLERISKLLVAPELSPTERSNAIVTGMAKALSGLASSSCRLVTRIVGEGNGQVRIEMGHAAERTGTEVLSAALDGFTEGLVWAEVPDQAIPPITVGGFVLGVPGAAATRPSADSQSSAPGSTGLLEAVGIGMSSEAFVMTIVCEPAPIEHIARTETDVWIELNTLSPKASVSKTTEQSETSLYSSTLNDSSSGGLPVISTRQKGKSTSDGNNVTIGASNTVEHRSIGYCTLVDHLTEYADRLHTAAMEGGWRVGIFLGATSPTALERLATLAVAALGGDGNAAVAPTWSPSASAVELLEGQIPKEANDGETGSGAAWRKRLSFLTSSELARVLALPCRDMPGYVVVPSPRFGVQSHEGDIVLGQVMTCMRPAQGVSMAISADDLTRHALVVGITGSGKTNTVFHLLGQAKVPFLVIEPVKHEYRALLHSIPGLRVYTPGQEGISPIRLNPFWFQYGTSLTLQQHVDSLKAIFCSMFAMYASMPNILERCLYNVYERKGWCLYDSSNLYARSSDSGPCLSLQFYPTLGDLWAEIDRYMSGSGYAAEQEQNIRSALLVRLDSLMKGGKGLLLNTSETVPANELFECPTVIELDAIPDEDEKALAMGLLMLRLYEYLKVSPPPHEEHLRHLLVIEEAHRVFRNVPSSSNPEIPNLAGKTVGMLSNMLAEIRSYGEGVMIVEQVPTKLAPDATKNTNLKIVHRLVSRDDCDYMSSALGISPEEAQACALLKRGEALVFAEGMDKPACVQVDLAPLKSSQVGLDRVREAARDFNPVILRRARYNPLAAIVLQDGATARSISVAARRFARNLLFDDVRHFHAAWKATTQEVERIADRGGYGLGEEQSVHSESFVDHVLRHIFGRLPGRMMLVGNDTRTSTFLAVYLERALSYSQEPYDHDAKALDQIGAVRTASLYPNLTRVYQRGLRSEEHSQLPLDALPFTYTDGEALEILRSWPSSHIASMVARDRPVPLDGLIQSTRQRVIGEFAVSPLLREPVDAITRRIVSLLKKGCMTQPTAQSVLRRITSSDI